MSVGYAKQHRQLRVFISSTFADMNTERDALTVVFPQIKELCKERGVSFVPLDLRWGITENAAKQGRVIETCLREIDQSRPFFIGIVGNRYGWIPQKSDLGLFGDNLIKQYPWLQSAIDAGMSITEMEMQYGVLRQTSDSSIPINAAFYLRSPKMVVCEEFCDPVNSESAEKLHCLRSKIRDQHIFPVRDYDNPQQLTEQVLNDLRVFLDREYPKEKISSWESTVVEQELILESRAKSLFNLSRYDNEFQLWLDSDKNHWLSISGANGIGKSYLLSSFANRLRSRDDHPAVIYCDIMAMRDIEAVVDFVSVEILSALGVRTRPQSERYELMGCFFSIVIGIIKFIFNLFIYIIRWAFGNQKKAEEYISNSYWDFDESVSDVFWRQSFDSVTKSLQKKPKRHVYVALDNLDSLNSQELALLNLFSELPHIKYMCTCSTGTKAHVHLINVIKATELKVYNLFESQAKDFIINYLAPYGKRLDEQGKQLDLLVHSSFGGNPQLLSYILNLLVCFGSFEGINSYINSLAAVKNSEEIYKLLIQNIQKLFPLDQGGFAASKVLTALSLIPGGIEEEELKEVLELKPLEWAMVRPYILNLCFQKGNVLYLPRGDRYNAVCATTTEYKETVSQKLIDYYEGLLKVRLSHSELMEGPDIQKIKDDIKKLLRQVNVLPHIYMSMGYVGRLYSWCTYLPADTLMSEPDRINYWRLLYYHNCSMHKAPFPDLSPAIKFEFAAYLVPIDEQRFKNYVRNVYEDSPLLSSKEELIEMYKRWIHVAALLQQEDDIKWLNEKLMKLGVDMTDKKFEKKRMVMQNQVLQLLKENRLDEIILYEKKPRYPDICQATIDYCIGIAYEKRGDASSAFRCMQQSFSTLIECDAIYLSEMIPILCVYGDLAVRNNETETINALLPILENHLKEQQQNGIDSTNMLMLLPILSRIYLAVGRKDDSLRTAKLWFEACTAMNMHTEKVSRFIAKLEKDSN